MAISSGIDIIRISRIRDIYNRKGDIFLNRIYTSFEIRSCTLRSGEVSMESLAARFAAKEAVSKALGTGIWRQGVSFTDIEIFVDEKGKPFLQLHGGAKAVFERMGGSDASVSISHDGDLATAICVIEYVRNSDSGDGE
ncbi:MAG: holo-ACP synthase [Clostridiaceae bacterium]|jgi:holo-[acyl-carrier protein] synthase|nr:holo-ACP synthase [Clostridiaceae bacterium]